MANAGSITARLGLDDSKFKAGVHNAGKWSKTKFAAIGGAAAASFAGAFAVDKFRDAMERAASIRELSEQTGMTADEFQRLDYQMRQAGGTTQDVVRGMNTLDRMMARANEGNEQAINDFKRLGIELDDLNDMSRLDVLNRMAEVVTTMTQDQRGGVLDSLRRLLNDDAARKFVGAFQEGWASGLSNAVVMSDEILDNMKSLTGAIQDLNDKALGEMAKILSENKDDLLTIISATSSAINGMTRLLGGSVRFAKSVLNLPETTGTAGAFGQSMFVRDVASKPIVRPDGMSREDFSREMLTVLKQIRDGKEIGYDSMVIGN